jgi:alpha/beta superfamily hydrolase
MFLHGGNDSIVPTAEVDRVVAKLRTQKGITIASEVVPEANHFWNEQLPEVERRVGAYIDRRMAGESE